MEKNEPPSRLHFFLTSLFHVFALFIAWLVVMGGLTAYVMAIESTNPYASFYLLLMFLALSGIPSLGLAVFVGIFWRNIEEYPRTYFGVCILIWSFLIYNFAGAQLNDNSLMMALISIPIGLIVISIYYALIAYTIWKKRPINGGVAPPERPRGSDK
ncbi:MAG: hypothetical protein KJ017_04115 [Alphaproteobacteria bacterium]|nr:hypothetical protein [Alphaproteobacteria bacterium]